MRTHKKQRGFTLLEIVIATLFLGLIFAPMLAFVNQVPNLNSAIGQQGRREAWRSFGDQALEAGIDPTQAAALSTAVNTLIPSVALPAVTRRTPLAVGGKATVSALIAPKEEGTVEDRVGGGGYELGAGNSVPAITIPTSPLTPIVMQNPVVTPLPGTTLRLSDLVAAGGGSPYTKNVSASSSESKSVVRINMARPSLQQAGVGAAGGVMTAVDLALGASGLAWAEYQGDVEFDKSAVLMDGKTRWFVRRPDGRLQIYEPSTGVNIAYKLDMGPLELKFDAAIYEQGSGVDVAYPQYRQLQNRTSSMRIDYPAATKAVFGTSWASLNVGWDWTFQAVPGPFSGDVTGMFTDENLTLWTDTVTIAASSVLPAGVQAQSGNWTLHRIKTKLGKPELVNTPDGAGFYNAGDMEFQSPQQADGSRQGRMSFRSGTVISTGSSLNLPVTP